MAIKSVIIINLLSFDKLIINDVSDINCIVGKNNTGKSNLLKLIQYFFTRLEGGRELTPELNSEYSSFGSITIVYDTSRIKKIVTSNRVKKTPFFKHVYNVLFREKSSGFEDALNRLDTMRSTYKLTLTINKNESIEWSTKDQEVLNVINYLYPFFEIQTRHIDLYDWNKIWNLISRLKSFNINSLKSEEIIEFFNNSLSKGNDSYSDYVAKVKDITSTATYSYREKVLNYVKVGLEGQTFTINGEELNFQSDGTNSYNYVEIFLKLLISLTRREYITPAVFIDEPETGLHPKMSERLIGNLSDVYRGYEKVKKRKEAGKYATPYPKIFLATHSPNIIKSTIKMFPDKHQVFHFSKNINDNTVVNLMRSQYEDKRFLNVFGDNEARLFFSDFIMFVEGETEVELFQNEKLCKKFKALSSADIYKSNMVQFGGLNPAFSNAAIPYLVLYDLDKFFKIDLRTKNISLKHEVIKFRPYLQKYKRSYFGSEERRSENNLRTITESVDRSEVVLDSKNLFVEGISGFGGFGISYLVSFMNQSVLKNIHHMAAPTTIEGAIISAKSLSLFKRWIVVQVFKTLGVEDKVSAPHRVSSLMRSTILDDMDSVVKSMSSLLTDCDDKATLSPIHNRFIKNLRKSYIQMLFHSMENDFDSEEELISALRMMCGGKSDSLAKKNNQLVDQNFVGLVDKLLLWLGPLNKFNGKTSGWVTSFINFSIDELDKNNKGENFDLVFKGSFPFLHAILSRLQP